MVSSDSSFLELSSFRICSLIGDRVVAALDGAGDRAGLDAAAVDAHEHFRRGADQIFAFAEIDEEGIGRRVDRLQLREISDGCGLAALVEHLAGHDLEQVAALEALHRLAHQLGIFAGLVVAARRDAVGGLERLGDVVARQALGRKTVARIVVAVGPGLGRIVVDDQDLVGQDTAPGRAGSRRARACSSTGSNWKARS